MQVICDSGAAPTGRLLGSLDNQFNNYLLTKFTMKTILLSLALSAVALMANPTTTHAQSGDETAIRKVIDDLRVAFKKRDLPAFSNCFTKSADLYSESTPGLPTVDLMVTHGYDTWIKGVSDYFKLVPTPGTSTFSSTDFRLRVNDTSAYASDGAIETMLDGTKNMSRVFYVFEKQDGTWKIASLISHGYRDGKLVESK